MSKDTTIDDLILGYAAGRLPEAVRFVMANHLELSPSAGRLATMCDAVGGAMMGELPGTRIRRDLFDDVLAAIDNGSPYREDGTLDQYDSDLPNPLRARLGRSVDELEWREFSGIGEYVLSPLDEDGYCTKLVRVRAGRSVPQHTHDGDELTLILRGAFDDGNGRYERGDLSIADHAVDHRPVADSREDCLCLAVTNAPIRLSGTITRFLNPFLRF